MKTKKEVLTILKNVKKDYKSTVDFKEWCEQLIRYLRGSSVNGFIDCLKFSIQLSKNCANAYKDEDELYEFYLRQNYFYNGILEVLENEN